jgi:signal transduction histidine kinase
VAGSTATQAPAIIQEVLATLPSRLEWAGSALVRDSRLSAELTSHVVDVLTDALCRAELPAGSVTAPTSETRLRAVEVGADHARRGIHLAESLRVAAVLFEVALPAIAARHATGDPAAVVLVGVALHEAIMERMALASLSYVDFLLARLQASQQEERRRIARELHDEVSHGMAAAAQHLDLHHHFARQDPERASVMLTAAAGALADALRTVQQLSAELRRPVGTGDDLQRALEEYLRANVPSTIRTVLEVTGDTKTLSPTVSDELYLILREATRNAVRHADPTEVRLAVAVTETTLTASVTDDGRGFDPATVDGCGLASMSERAQVLHGSLELASAYDRGTTVSLRVPLPGSGS